VADNILTEVRNRYRFQKTEIPSKEGIQLLMKKIIVESKELQPDRNAPTILELLQGYIDKYERDWTAGFAEIVNATLEHLKTFEAKRQMPLTAGENYSDVWTEFKGYLISLKFNNSTSNKYLKLFRRLLRYLAQNDHIKLKVEELKPFKELESFRIALKEGEIETLANAKFEEPHLTHARDLMILQLFTAQRVGDLPQVLEQIQRGGDIHIAQGKGKKRLTIPKYPLLEKHVAQIAERHPNGLRTISNQKYNKYIKDCCRLAKIDREHTYIELKGDAETQETKKRYDLVSSHTCRRTFATLANKKGISHKAIMAITGHTSHKVFLEYIRIDDQDVDQEFKHKMK